MASYTSFAACLLTNQNHPVKLAPLPLPHRFMTLHAKYTSFFRLRYLVNRFVGYFLLVLCTFVSTIVKRTAKQAKAPEAKQCHSYGYFENIILVWDYFNSFNT
jgi:hypothetical protein